MTPRTPAARPRRRTVTALLIATIAFVGTVAVASWPRQPATGPVAAAVSTDGSGPQRPDSAAAVREAHGQVPWWTWAIVGGLALALGLFGGAVGALLVQLTGQERLIRETPSLEPVHAQAPVGAIAE